MVAECIACGRNNGCLGGSYIEDSKFAPAPASNNGHEDHATSATWMLLFVHLVSHTSSSSSSSSLNKLVTLASLTTHNSQQFYARLCFRKSSWLSRLSLRS